MMKYGLVFSALSIALGWAAVGVTGLFLLVVGYCAVSTAIVSVAYFVNRPVMLGKQASGRVWWLATILLFPYLLFQYLVFMGARRASFPPSEISASLVLGPRLSSGECALLDRLGVSAILDLTAEFPEPRSLIEGRSYLCIPVLDGVAPSAAQFEGALAWMNAQQGRVYVHCAQGHGRSATVVLVWLVQSGGVAGLDQAMELLQARRPRARPNKFQYIAASQFLEHHVT